MHGKQPWRIILLLCAAGWLGYEIYSLRKNSLRYVARMNNLLARTMQNAPEHMPVPLVILDDRQQILWYNEAFSEHISAHSDVFGLPLQSVLPFRPDALADGESMELGMYDRQFRVSRTDYDRKGSHAELFCFEDITNYVTLRSSILTTTRICSTEQDRANVLRCLPRSNRCLIRCSKARRACSAIWMRTVFLC